MNKLFDKILGEARYTIEHRDRVKQLTVYLNDNEMLFVSIQPKISSYDMMHILNSILPYTSAYAEYSYRFSELKTYSQPSPELVTSHAIKEPFAGSV